MFRGFLSSFTGGVISMAMAISIGAIVISITALTILVSNYLTDKNKREIRQ